jgi:hypothetical protein
LGAGETRVEIKDSTDGGNDLPVVVNLRPAIIQFVIDLAGWGDFVTTDLNGANSFFFFFASERGVSWAGAVMRDRFPLTLCWTDTPRLCPNCWDGVSYGGRL